APPRASTHTATPPTPTLFPYTTLFRSHAEYPWLRETGLTTNVLGDNGIPVATIVQNHRDIVDYKLISFFGRMNYNINDVTVVLRSEEHTSELQSLRHLVCRLLLEKKKM